jgi:hypothetical protein
LPPPGEEVLVNWVGVAPWQMVCVPCTCPCVTLGVTVTLAAAAEALQPAALYARRYTVCELLTVRVGAELAVLVPVAEVCQYQVALAGGVPLVTVLSPQVLEDTVGTSGVAGGPTTVTASETADRLRAENVTVPVPTAVN